MNRDFKTFTRVVKFAIEEESNHGRRSEKSVSIHSFACALCTVLLVLRICSRILASGSEVNLFFSVV